jgi:hypothetical protein
MSNASREHVARGVLTEVITTDRDGSQVGRASVGAMKSGVPSLVLG